MQKIVIRDKLVERVRVDGEKFQGRLRERIGDVEAVGDIRGRGFFVGIELVEHRDTKQPFNPELTVFDRIRKRGMESGLICYPVGGTLDGVQGDVAILAPPFIATDNELEEIIDKFDSVLRRVLDDVTKAS